MSYKGSPQALSALLSGEVQFYLIGSVGTDPDGTARVTPDFIARRG